MAHTTDLLLALCCGCLLCQLCRPRPYVVLKSGIGASAEASGAIGTAESTQLPMLPGEAKMER